MYSSLASFGFFVMYSIIVNIYNLVLILSLMIVTVLNSKYITMKAKCQSSQLTSDTGDIMKKHDKRNVSSLPNPSL